MPVRTMSKKESESNLSVLPGCNRCQGWERLRGKLRHQSDDHDGDDGDHDDGDGDNCDDDYGNEDDT